MKITVHTFSSDDDDGTNANAYGTEREAEDDMLETIGKDRAAFDAWLVENPDGDIWEFKDEEGEHDGQFDTYNLGEDTIEVPLCGQPLPFTGREQVAEAIECLQRARDLLKASGNKQTLARVRLALSSAKGAARIQDGREQRELQLRREYGAAAQRQGLPRETNPINEFTHERQYEAWNMGWDEAAQSDVPADFPVQPIEFQSAEYHAARHDGALAQCGICSRMWDDSIATGMTPVPAGRCPFEAYHAD